MLLMKPRCERCSAPTPADASNAHICSFECTFCRACAEGELAGICPNCGGQLLPRPTRVGEALRRNPPREADQ